MIIIEIIKKTTVIKKNENYNNNDSNDNKNDNNNINTSFKSSFCNVALKRILVHQCAMLIFFLLYRKIIYLSLFIPKNLLY